MFIYPRHIFVLYIIHQDNPVSISLRCIIPWSLRNRSYRRRAPSYRRHPIKLPSSVISDKFAVVSRRIFRGLLYKNEKRYESLVLVQGVPCLRVQLLQVWERSVVAIKPEQAKTSPSERPRRRHLDDGSFVRLPPVLRRPRRIKHQFSSGFSTFRYRRTGDATWQ